MCSFVSIHFYIQKVILKIFIPTTNEFCPNRVPMSILTVLSKNMSFLKFILHSCGCSVSPMVEQSLNLYLNLYEDKINL